MPFPNEPCQTCPRVELGLSLPCSAQLGKSKNLCRKLDKNDEKFNEEMYKIHSHEKFLIQNAVQEKERKTEIREKQNQSEIIKKFTDRELSERNMVSGRNYSEVIKHVNNCNHRSIRKTSKNSDGIDVVVHVIKNDDGSSVEYGDCGCGMNRCRLLKGSGLHKEFVSYNDCRQCVIDRGLVALEPPPKNPGFGDVLAGQAQTTGFAGSGSEPSLRDGQ